MFLSTKIHPFSKPIKILANSPSKLLLLNTDTFPYDPRLRYFCSFLPDSLLARLSSKIPNSPKTSEDFTSMATISPSLLMATTVSSFSIQLWKTILISVLTDHILSPSTVPSITSCPSSTIKM